MSVGLKHFFQRKSWSVEKKFICKERNGILNLQILFVKRILVLMARTMNGPLYKQDIFFYPIVGLIFSGEISDFILLSQYKFRHLMNCLLNVYALSS